MFDVRDPHISPLHLLRPNLVVVLEWKGSPMNANSKTATILAITTKAGTLSQNDLELYDKWDGGDPQKNFETIAEYLGNNVP